jgi:DcmR-like sensory protein
MTPTAAPIPFAGSNLDAYRHVCAFFTTPDEEYRTMLSFVRDGLAHGDRIFHATDRRLRDDYVAHLRGGGIDVDASQGGSQLEVRSPKETYFRRGHFDKDAMLELIQEVLEAGSVLGFPLTRISAHVDWVLKDWPSSDDWIEYETRLNYVVPRYQDPVICTYDCNTLGAGMAMDILRTHPVVVIGGVMQENPFFVPPSEFLRELKERRSPAHRESGDIH